ncbi:MAG: nucleotidyl transferase AbiEii/AbiGii toxin family protein [Candidatus Aenigmarchaeota archaeon]|nr:nucleotidyl transferase AbiEii/AbiGii toxin family protein [Candidatus Aenigmarchaeota archaeon]
MDLEQREKTIFETLKQIADLDIILVGGYAINAYVLPRFSVDCDVVISQNIKEIKSILIRNSFIQTEADKRTPYLGRFMRFEKNKAAVDVLINGVTDRSTDMSFPYDLIRQNSEIRETVARASAEKISLRIANPEMLFVMKFVSCRRQDIRDIFILANTELNEEFIIKTLETLFASAVSNKEKIKQIITNQSFRDALQGVYGFVPENTFEAAKKKLLKILNKLQ